jgi:hypothetical protein
VIQDDDLKQLGALPKLDLAPKSAEAIRHVAVSEYRRAHGRSELGVRLTWTWSRVMLPALLCSTTIVYLAWAVQSASAIYR